MPTIKIDINTGIEYSPTDGIDSGVKLHNFTVGSDGSLYKLPILKNLKNTRLETVGNKKWPHKLVDLKKFQTYAKEDTNQTAGGMTFHESDMFRRFLYLTEASYGVMNYDYGGNRIKNSDLPSGDDYKAVKEFDYKVYSYVKTGSENDIFDLNSLNPHVLYDYNENRCVFPAQHMWLAKGANYKYSIQPRNIIHCTMDPDKGNADIKPLTIHGVSDSERKINDIARGCVLIGNRMFFYSTVDKALYPSTPNNFTQQMKEEDSSHAFKRVPAEAFQSITDFNGNIYAFTPSGLDRWVLSNSDKQVVQRDPTFHFDHRIRFTGSFVKANRDLYYYTDDFHVYKLTTNLSVEEVFSGELPFYKPLENYLNKNEDLPMAYFEMLGHKFVSIGPWLYNTDSGKWSTYSYDGYLGTPDVNNWIFENDVSKRIISCGYDDLIGTYHGISRPLTYKEMQGLPDSAIAAQSLEEDKYQWGDFALYTSRQFQDDRTFSLDGVYVYVRGGILKTGATLLLQILSGDDPGDFDVDQIFGPNKEAYWKANNIVPMKYEPRGKHHIGRFVWRCNIKTDRFRIQLITNEKRGFVIQSAFCNITNISDSQKSLTNQNTNQTM